MRAIAGSIVRLSPDARTAIARAILAASTTLAFLAPWWWVPLPLLMLLTLLFAALAAAAVSWRPDAGLVALGAVLGACLQPPDQPPDPLPLLLALGAVHGAVAAEIARLATALRDERPVRAIQDATLAGGAIVVVSTLPVALVLGGVPLLIASGGLAVGAVALAGHLRANAWLRRVADGRVCDAELRVTDSDQGLPIWSTLLPAAGPARLLMVDPVGGSLLPYRSARCAIAVVRAARTTATSRARPWLLAIAVVVASLLVTAVSVTTCRCGRTDALARARTDARTLRGAAEHHLAVTGDCPSLVDLVASKHIDPASRVDDPWGTTYRIACEGGDASVLSPGPDKRWNTEDDVVVK